MRRLTIPRTFWDDHAERCGDHPGKWDEIKRTKRVVIVELNDEALTDLRSDADYYADQVGFEPEVRGLCRSAKATLEAINRQITG